MDHVAVKTYQTTNIMTTDPYKLILMLYDEVIKRLFQTREAIKAGDIKARGEHLSKVIDIINELLASVKGDETNEAASFLRGLYSAILTELPKVNITNDVVVIERSIKYLAQLRNIWKDTVMNTPKDEKTSCENNNNLNKSNSISYGARQQHVTEQQVGNYTTGFSVRG